MRIRTLELTRFGKFTDAVLDFGEATAGRPDLHVVYGPNEAGKSTTFAAVLDLLFGIRTQSPYSFLHPYPSMRIGATLELLGEPRRFIRIKKPQNSLLDGDERPLPEAAILAELGGMDRDAYEKMFFLDDGTLEKGGEDILASEGELGKLLFSASAGLADLGGRLAALKTETEGFYKFRARSGRLGELKSRLAELKSQREALDFVATEHRELVAQRDRLVDAFRQANTERAETQNRIDEIGRILLAMPRLVELNALVEELSGLQEVKPIVAGWKEEVPRLERRVLEQSSERRRLREHRERVERELSEVSADPLALALAVRMGRLAALKARFMTAEGDIPKLRARLAETTVDGILIRFGRRGEPDPDSLVLDAVIVGEFSELIEARSGIDARQRSAADELEKVRRLLDRAKLATPNVSLEEHSSAHTLYEALSASVAAYRNASLETRVLAATRARKQAADLLEDSMRRLAPWVGEPDDLVVDPFPDRLALSRWTSSYAESLKAIALAEAEMLKFESELRQLEGEAAAVKLSIGSAAAADASETRAMRDKAWADHRSSLSNDTAETFEAKMRLDDMVAAERSAKVADIERLKQLSSRASVVRADLETATVAHQTHAARCDAVLIDISKRFEDWKSGSAWRLEPAGLAEWLSLRDKALDARDKLRDADAAASDAMAELNTAEENLRRQMAALGLEVLVDHGLPRMIEAAQVAVDAQRHISNQRKELLRLQEDVDERSRQLGACVREDAAWKNKWQSLCEACWIGSLPTIPGTTAMKEIILASDVLAKTLETRAGLIDRIEKMEKDQEDFRNEVRELCGLMNLSIDSTELELARLMEDSVREAEDNVDRTKKAQLELEKLTAAELQLADQERDVADQCRRMMDHFGVETLEQIRQSIAAAERHAALRKRIAEAEHQLVETMRAKSVDAVAELIAGANRQELLTEEIALRGLLGNQETRCLELFHQQSKAIDRLESEGGDGKVAEIEEQRRTILLDIEEQARQYLVLRAGAIAADHALALYRDQHRSSMMAKASEAFATISRGFYKGLAVQPSKNGETLIAIASSGGSKAADQLSKGARFQLYLALRVAGYHEFVSSRSAVPFIADDIMETFDDFRAEEAFRLFDGMAERGQVIYMTHHRHLAAIAKDVCPSVRVHDLESVIAAARSAEAAE